MQICTKSLASAPPLAPDNNTPRAKRKSRHCISFAEHRHKGKPSGISTTEADMWVHELKRDGETLCYLMFPIERLKALCREAIRNGQYRTGGGDGGEFDNVLLRLADILR